MLRLCRSYLRQLRRGAGGGGPGGMLPVLLLTAVATVRLWPMASAQPLCSMYTVRTGKMFKIQQPGRGMLLYSAYPTVTMIRHRCKDKMAVYLGKKVFLTFDNFRSSLLPLRIPRWTGVQKAEVTSVHFSSDIILFVVNWKVFIYNYEESIWSKASGVHHPVSHVTGDTCCFEGNTFCLEHLTGILEGIFYFHSLSQMGVLVIKGKDAVFIYSDHPLNHSWGLFFERHEHLDIIQSPGQRGFLIFWNQTSLFVSPNAGQFVETVRLQTGNAIVLDSVIDNNITIHSIASNENELAVLTREDHLYYGSQGYLRTAVIRLMDQNLWTEDTAIMFETFGMLEVLIPIPDSEFSAFDFRKCTVNIQQVLMDPSLNMKPCNVELLEGQLESDMYTIDMNSRLHLSALLIPRPKESPIPLVMVSNPHSLGVRASMMEFGTTFDGNSKYKVEIELKQQHLWGRADRNFTISMKHNAISALTVDIADKEISCVDLKPLSTLISVGCDLQKKIIVQNKISACAMGILDPMDLQGNYSYVIEKEAYRPVNHEGEAKSDLLVFYEYKDLGCPRLVYYDAPWKPVVELWRDGVMQEIVDAEYVLTEMNGIFTYSYSLTAETAGCKSQPQNWTTILATEDNSEFKFWDRENYVSCHELTEDRPLLWPNAQYQILGGRTNNKVVFDQRNGIYIFALSIVDPYYSYCHLDTVFSIFVYGAFPLPLFPPTLTILLLTITILLSVGLAYAIPKLLETEKGHHFKRVCSRFFCCCIWFCSCPWLQHHMQRWLHNRKMRVGPGARQQSATADPKETKRYTDKLQLPDPQGQTDSEGETDTQEWPERQTQPRRRSFEAKRSSPDSHMPTSPWSEKVYQ